MSGMLSIARREFVERRVVLWASLAAAVIPFMSPLIPGLGARAGSEARELMCLILAAAIGVGATLLVGAGIIARDLSEGRMSFDFSRPVGALSIWAGRFAGAVGVVLGAVAVVLLPTAVAGRFGPPAGANHPMGSLAVIAGAAVGTVLCLLPLAHAASVALRSKSAWLGLDLVALLVVALTVGLIERALIEAWALVIALGVAVGLGIVAVLALWAASIAQVTAGRTDLRRGHRAQAICLWGLMGLALAVASGYVLWVFAAGPRDLVELEVSPSPRGDWVGVNGLGQGRFDYRVSLLVNARDGRVVRLGGALPWNSEVQFSADGGRAVWIHRDRKAGEASEVTTIDLTAHEPELRRSTVTVPTSYFVWPVLSPDGRRLAMIDDGILSVHDLDSGRVEASVRITRAGGFYPPRARFTRDGKIRLYYTEPRLEIYECDPAARTITKTGEGFALDDNPIRGLSPDAERLIVRREDPKENVVVDGRTGAVLASFPRTQSRGTVFTFLHDGRIVMAERSEAAVLRVLSRDGAVEREFPLGRSDLWMIGAEPEVGKLLVSFGEAERDESGTAPAAAVDTYLLDLTTGGLREVAKRRAPVMIWESGRFAPGDANVAAQLFYDGQTVVRIDPRTGQERLVAGTHRSR